MIDWTCHRCGEPGEMTPRCKKCLKMRYDDFSLWYPKGTIPVDDPERLSREGRISTGAEGRVNSRGGLMNGDKVVHSG